MAVAKDHCASCTGLGFFCHLLDGDLDCMDGVLIQWRCATLESIDKVGPTLISC